MVNYCKPSIQYLPQATACRTDFSVQEATIHSSYGQHISFMPRGIGTPSYSTPAYSTTSQLPPSTKPFSGEQETVTVKLLTCSTGNHSLRKQSGQKSTSCLRKMHPASHFLVSTIAPGVITTFSHNIRVMRKREGIDIIGNYFFF